MNLQFTSIFAWRQNDIGTMIPLPVNQQCTLLTKTTWTFATFKRFLFGVGEPEEIVYKLKWLVQKQTYDRVDDLGGGTISNIHHMEMVARQYVYVRGYCQIFLICLDLFVSKTYRRL